jgi:L,D-transpeptidase catalytic domain/Bacterial SH3 domain
MTISRRRHYWTVGILTATIVLLGAPLLILLFGFSDFKGFFSKVTPIDEYGKEEIVPDKLYLQDEEIIIIPQDASTGHETVLKIERVLFEYVEVTDGCGPHFEDECLLVRSGPGSEYPVISRLRNGVVLKVDGKVERDGTLWYKIIFDEWLRYPERVKDDWYVAADYVEALYDEGDKTIWENDYASSTLKRIEVDRSEQKLSAYEGEELFMEISISTGLELTPTPRGTFNVFKKTPSRYMQGPLPGLADQQYYDLPGVPWNLYFTQGGAVIHGAYWHTSFGTPYSHGCVNLSPEDARKLYYWADLGTYVVVKD